MSYQIYIETENHDTTIFADTLFEARQKAKAWQRKINERIRLKTEIEVD